MEMLLFLYNKVRRCIICPLKSIIYINILVFNTHQTHILTFTSTVVSSVGGFVVPGVEFMYLYSLCCSNDWWWFNISLCKYLQWLLWIYNKIKIFILKVLSMIVQHVWWWWNKNQIFVKQYSLLFYCQLKKTFKKMYFCIKCTLDAKEEI